jgi:hypothetical protein
MQDHRSAGELPESRANPSPPIGDVHGLGESHALRVDLRPVQAPWLADEIDTLRAVIGEELAVARARHDQLSASPGTSSETAGEVERRIYQLRVLGMIREQLPVTPDVVAACVGDPWQPDDRAQEAARITAPVTVVGPARGMLVLIRGAATNVADALGEAVRGPLSSTRSSKGSPEYLGRWPEWNRLTPDVASRLRDLAAAAEAWADTYVKAVAQQAYSFDPEHYPVYPDELWG